MLPSRPHRFRPHRFRPPARRRSALFAAGLTAVALVAASACGTTTGPTRPATSADTLRPVDAAAPAAPPSTATHPLPVLPGDGLAQADGVRLVTATTTLPPDQPTAFTFQLQGSDGAAITTVSPHRDGPMHLHLIRSDLAGFQHVQPTMSPDGTWTARLAATPTGFYRAFVAFRTRIAGRDTPLVLSQPIVVPGAAVPVALPAPSGLATVDGYTLTLAAPRGMPVAGTTRPITVTVTRDGRPVTDLEPSPSGPAHVSAFREGDLAFTHLPAVGTTAAGRGGPDLTFAANLPRAGTWRLFIQFTAAGIPHTAAVTVPVA